MISLNKQIFKQVKRNSSVVVLCSSGVDSIAVSHFFIENFGMNYNVSLLHFNHNLRKQNFEMVDSFINFANSVSVPYEVVQLSCKDATEDSCRKARLSHLENYRNTTFITAHHLDDCVESYFLNCLRGKEGFLPIPFRTELSNSNCIVRPFIFNRKKDFLSYAKGLNLLQYVVEDETNKKTKGSRRNLLRNEVLPIFERERMGLSKIVKKKMLDRLQRTGDDRSSKLNPSSGIVTAF